ncbi:DUF4333 domain-containing protein [Mycobacteroides abscessus]|uniref:DUF4333 domain-containing protein n=1 Tax=Mycobacteroides abscessus TaxID=36809 RepID=UPI002353AA5B|nr:DUF4333 domain-containing protein [Mycobacteroides abscessus]
MCSCSFHASMGPSHGMPKHDLEAGIGRVLARWNVDTRSVKCDGDLPAQVGKEQTCWARMSDGSNLKMVSITTKVDGQDIRYDVEVDGKVAEPRRGRK